MYIILNAEFLDFDYLINYLQKTFKQFSHLSCFLFSNLNFRQGSDEHSIYPLHNWLAPKITSEITKVSAHFMLIHITDLPSRKAVLIYPLMGDAREEPLVGLPCFQTLPGHLHFLFCRLLMFPTCSFGVNPDF